MDMGGFTSKVCVAWQGSDTIELHVNRVSNRETPTVVAFDKRVRVYGEEADLRITSLHSSAICLLPYIVGNTLEEFKRLIGARKYLFSVKVDQESSQPAFTVTFDDQQHSVQPEEVYAFFLNQLLQTVRKQLGSNVSTKNGDIHLSLPVPGYFTDGQKQALVKSLGHIGFGSIRVYKQSECLLSRWCDSHLQDVFDGFIASSGKHSMQLAFLDVGFCHCTFFVAEMTKGEPFERKILSEESNDLVGTYQMIEILAEYIREVIKDTKGEDVKVPSRQALYIFKACAKALKELSVVNEVKIDCERVLSDGDDFSITVSREKFEELCEPLKNILQCMIDNQMNAVEVGSLLAIEAVGGGCRVPFVKAILMEEATKKEAPQAVRMSMDSTSATANGAVCLAKSNAQPLLDPEDPELKLSEDEFSKQINQEERFAVVETEELNKRSVLNEIDQYIIKTKNDARGEYSKQLKLEDVDALLNALDEFALDAAHNKDVNAAECQKHLDDCRQQVYDRAPDYSKALDEAEKAKEDEIRKSKLETDAPFVSEVNMDVTLPKATCIKRAVKNKEEGNALISGGNTEMAAQHYIKALQYCSKVSDANDEEKEQLNSLKLASNLNLAMCYIKMNTEVSYRKAVVCCTHALEISDTSTKALYRRAFAYDKLNKLEDALSDARLGVQKFPDNADLKLLHEILEKKVKVQEHRLKKVYSRMF